MAKIEIDEDQIKEMQAAHELLRRLYAGKHKRDLEKMAKEVNPSAVTTDDFAAPFMDEIRKEFKPLLDWKEKMDKNISDYNKNEEIRRLKDSGYTEDGIKAIEKIAEDKKVDLDMAAAYFDKTRPVQPVAPNGLSPSMWNFAGEMTDDKDDMKLLMGSHADEDAALDRMAAKAMKEWGTMGGSR